MSRTTLKQGIEDPDMTTAFRGSTQFTQHAQMIGGWVLSEDKNGFGLFKIFQQYRAYTTANLFGQCNIRSFMTKIGTIGQIIGSELTHKKLIQKCRFIGSATLGVKQSLVGAIQASQTFSD